MIAGKYCSQIYMTISGEYRMKGHSVLEKPSSSRRAEFLAAVARSRKLHRHWAHPPSTHEEFTASLKRLRSGVHVSYWICTEAGELAGVININEIVPACSAPVTLDTMHSCRTTDVGI